jgi:hypothetical protein
MADLVSGVSSENKLKTNGTTDERARAEGSKEEERDEYGRFKASTVYGKKSVEPRF